MKGTLVLLILFSVYGAFAQDETVKELKKASEKTIKKDPNDTISKTWKKGGLYGINISQGSLSNWAAGGDDFSLSVNSSSAFLPFIKKINIAGIIHLILILAM